ncbi:hypothetical protein [Stratiformator vulcanicus]|uniref:Uncharacterized protein n=1 Tax=Stratiformator vulcanicus TaxID=2527980 RepID=A0A517R2W0_9PLAN|nr:hypothetical protein [Stratiformator vulcanicus]QDT38194.1 hypothetical protein Pan189_25840 [Stratiformator vulcanicus]
MESILPEYRLDPATWCYLSLPLVIAVFFRFRRVWSLRNFDLLLLLSVTPGLLFVESHPTLAYTWLFGISAVVLGRLLCDGLLNRRPRLPQNLNPPGLLFLAIVATGLIAVEIATEDRLPTDTIATLGRAQDLVERRARPDETGESESVGPAGAVLATPAVGLSRVVMPPGAAERNVDFAVTISARIAAILSQLAVLVGLVFATRMLTGDSSIGIAAGALYVLLPCTALQAVEVNRVLPAGLLIWAVALRDRPVAAGLLLGLACGMIFCPIFLLPLWLRYYGRKEMLKFSAALVFTAALLAASLALTAVDADSFVRQVIGSIDWKILRFEGVDAGGFWSNRPQVYRIPVFTVFVILLIGVTVKMRRGATETLLAGSAAIMLAIQFWYPRGGGIYVLWYLPLWILVVFRPSRESRQRSKSPPRASPAHMTEDSSAGWNNVYPSERSDARQPRRKPESQPLPSKT